MPFGVLTTWFGGERMEDNARGGIEAWEHFTVKTKL